MKNACLAFALLTAAGMTAFTVTPHEAQSTTAALPVQLALQQCKGPSHNCGKTICHTTSVTVCQHSRPLHGDKQGHNCYIQKITSCT